MLQADQHLVADDLARAHLAVILVRAVDQVPARCRLVARRETAIDRFADHLVMTREPQVIVRDAPARQLVGAQLLQSLALRVGVEVQMNLDDAHTIGAEHRLQLSDALELPRCATLGLARIVELGAHVLRVPAPEVERDAAECGQRAPVAPHRRVAGLRIVLAERAHGDVLRIEPLDQLVDRLAAARGRDAGDDHDDGELRELARIELRGKQVVVQRRHEPAIVA